MWTSFLEAYQWLHEFVVAWGWWLAGASAIAFVATLVLVPVFVVQLPAGYFLRHRSAESWQRYHPAVRVAFLVLKNLLGIVFLVGGFIMLFMPGQGVLSMAIGIMLLDFPGKWEIERRVVGHPRVLKPINALRRRWGREPLVMQGKDQPHQDKQPDC